MAQKKSDILESLISQLEKKQADIVILFVRM